MASCSHGHTLIDSVEKEPSCTETGLTDGLICLVCKYSTQEVVEKIPHTKVVDVKGEMPSLLHTGIADISHCEVCGEKLSNGEVLPVAEPRSGNSSYRFDKFGEGSAEQRLYDGFYLACERLIEEDLDIEVDEKGYCVLEAFKPEEYGLNDDVIAAVWTAFLSDNPRYYFLRQFATFNENGFLLMVDEAYSTAENRKTYDESIKEMENECNRLFLKSASDLTKATKIHDYINNKITYAYQADGVTPETPESCVWTHNITGVSSLGRGVCEAYAKTFLYLCNLNDVECILVNGIAGEEEHSWNYACFDGCWYLIDLTFDDTESDYGKYTQFGLGSSALENTYELFNEEGVGIEYQHAMPELCDERLYIVELYKNDKYVGVYKSPDDAFAKMEGRENEYLLSLMNNTELFTYYQSNYSNLPVVKKITISAPDVSTSEGMFYVGGITFNDNLTFHSDLILRDCNLYLKKDMYLNKHTLFFDGENAGIGGIITFGESEAHEPVIFGEGGSFILKTKCSVEIYPEVYLTNMIVEDGCIQLCKNAEIENAYGLISVYGVNPYIPEISIKNWYPVEGVETPNNKLATTNKVNVTIGRIHGNPGLEFFICPNFGDLSEYPTICIKEKSDSEIELMPYGFQVVEIVDGEGNIISSERREAELFDVEKPLITLNSEFDISLLRINKDTCIVDSFDNIFVYTDNYEVKVSPDMRKDEDYYYLDTIICKRLKDPEELNLPEGFDTIFQKVFCDASFKSVIIPEGYTTFEDFAFSNCKQLEELILPSTMKSLGWGCFNNCSSLKKVEIKGQVEIIPSICFIYCSELQELTLPESLKCIEYGAFDLCEKLTNIYYEGTKEQWEKIEGKSLGYQVPATVVHCKDGDVNL